MIPPPFEYEVPSTIQEAVGLLDENENAKILAGGQSLLPMMKFRLANPALLIDINRIGGLEYIHEDGGYLKIGALTRRGRARWFGTGTKTLSAPGGHLPAYRRSFSSKSGHDCRKLSGLPGLQMAGLLVPARLYLGGAWVCDCSGAYVWHAARQSPETGGVSETAP